MEQSYTTGILKIEQQWANQNHLQHNAEKMQPWIWQITKLF